MRKTLPVTVLRCLGIGAMAIAAAAGIVPASPAQEPHAADPGKVAASGSQTGQVQAPDQWDDGPGSEARGHAGVFVAQPIGTITVGADFIQGEIGYARRQTVREGMTIVEVSTTPFMPELGPGQETPGGVQSAALPALW